VGAPLVPASIMSWGRRPRRGPSRSRTAGGRVKPRILDPHRRRAHGRGRITCTSRGTASPRRPPCSESPVEVFTESRRPPRPPPAISHSAHFLPCVREHAVFEESSLEAFLGPFRVWTACASSAIPQALHDRVLHLQTGARPMFCTRGRSSWRRPSRARPAPQKRKSFTGAGHRPESGSRPPRRPRWGRDPEPAERPGSSASAPNPQAPV